MATRPPIPAGPPPGAPMPMGGAPMGAGPGAAPPGGAPAGPGAGGPMVGGPQAAGGPDQLIKGILGLGKQIEQTLISFAQAMPQGAKFFQQANELIKQGIAAEMSAAGGTGEQPPAGSPTEAGPAFPGGGFTSGGRP